MTDFTKVCKELGITKRSKIAEFADKRVNEMKEEVNLDASQTDSSEPKLQFQGELDLLSFDYESRVDKTISFDED